VKKAISHLRNKYVLTSAVFVIFVLFLDENDIFTIMNQRGKLRTLENSKVEISEQLNKTLETLNKLKHTSEVERFAREKKLFKKDDEDVFVIYYE